MGFVTLLKAVSVKFLFLVVRRLLHCLLAVSNAMGLKLFISIPVPILSFS